MIAETIAQVCHEANRGYQAAVPTEGIPVAPAWDEFPADQQAGVISGVEFALAGATSEQLHESWCEEKYAAGWSYGETKDTDAKTHPCLLPYEELPAQQQQKDELFSSIVRALADEQAGTVVPTIKEHIDGAIEQVDELRRGSFHGPVERGDGREFALAITALEDAKMRTTRGLAKAGGIFNEVDLQKDSGLQRAKDNHQVNVAGNADGGIARS